MECLIDLRDTGDLPIDAQIAGIPIVVRHSRMALSCGLDGVTIVAQTAEHEAIRQLLFKQLPAAFKVQTATSKPQGEFVVVAFEKVYTRDRFSKLVDGQDDPLFTVRTQADLAQAKRLVLRSLNKSVAEDGVMGALVLRPLCRPLTRMLAPTRATPNFVTLLALLFGIAAAVCASLGTASLYIASGICLFINAILDAGDGDLARLKVQGSKFGQWLDSLTDDFTTAMLLFGLGIGLARGGQPEWWLWYSVAAGALAILVALKIYADLHRWNMPIDSSRYPWFFSTPQTAPKQSSIPSKLMAPILFIFRRDTYITGIAVLLVLGMPKSIIVILSSATAIFATLYILHIIVTKLKKDPAHPGFGWNIGYLGAKDFFTAINLAGGIAGIYFVAEGNVSYAAYALFLGFILGDSLDGRIARLTNTSNEFGARFDASVDYLTQSIIPALIVLVGFNQLGHPTLGATAMAFLVTSSCLREARANTASFNYSLTYCGLPRTISGLVAMAFPNSNLYLEFVPIEVLVLIVALLSILNLVPIPYMTHKGRKMQGYVKFAVALFLLGPPILIFTYPEFVWDYVATGLLMYALFAWLPIHPEERKDFWLEYKRWIGELQTK